MVKGLVRNTLAVVFALVLGLSAPALAAEATETGMDQAEDQVILTQGEEDATPESDVTPEDEDEPPTAVDDGEGSTDPDAGGDVEPSEPTGPVDPADPAAPSDPDDPTVPGDVVVPEEPVVPNGWDVLEDGSTCYYVDGELAKGWKEIDGLRYHFDDETGAMDHGTTLEIDGSTYLLANSGEMLTGWQTVDGELRYFDDETGAMLADGAYDIDGLAAPVSATSSTGINDVSESTPHHDDIQWLFDSGISTGWASGDGGADFRPGSGVVRQDMAAFLYRLAGSPDFTPSDSDVSRFSDVTATTPHALEIWWLASQGISEGWSDGTFRPTNTVVRQDMAAFLHRLAGNEPLDPAAAEGVSFTDVDESTPHHDDILWLAAQGISAGFSDGTFRPTNTVVRQDMAAFLHRMVDNGTYTPTATHEYLFDEDGALVTGWVGEGSDRRFYSPTNGALVPSGWVKEGTTWSYIDPASGELLKDGIHKVYGASYLFDQNGNTVRGWAESSDGWRFFDRSNCTMATDCFKTIDGARYHFKANGVMSTGWLKSNDSWYYFDTTSGKMYKSGAATIDGSTYYFKSNGVMGTGWISYSGAKHFFDRTSGKMYKGGIYAIDGSSYYFNSNGAMTTGLVTVSGSKYYFSPSTGKMVKNSTFSLDGVWYVADSNGKVTVSPAKYPDMLRKAQSYSSSTGWLILVDCSTNRCCIYRGSYGNWLPVKEWICTTGASWSPTVKGVFSVIGKGYSFGNGFTCYYYTQFYRDYLFHSVLYYQGTFRVMDGRLGIDASHGCVRLDINNAKYIYDNVPYGTTVVTY